MLSILSDATFSRTKCAGPTIAPTGTICIWSVCLTPRMNPSIQSAQPCGSLYFVGITTAYSAAWGRNINCWVQLHLVEKMDIIFPTDRNSTNWRIWFSAVQSKYTKGKEGTWPWKVLSRPFSIDWTQMLWDPDMIPWLALLYSTLQSSQTLNRCKAAKWLMVVQQPIVKIDKCTVYEYILIISEHHSTNLLPPVPFNWCTE